VGNVAVREAGEGVATVGYCCEIIDSGTGARAALAGTNVELDRLPQEPSGQEPP